MPDACGCLPQVWLGKGCPLPTETVPLPLCFKLLGFNDLKKISIEICICRTKFGTSISVQILLISVSHNVEEAQRNEPWAHLPASKVKPGLGCHLSVKTIFHSDDMRINTN